MTDEQFEAFRTFPLGGRLPNRLRLALLLKGISIRELAKLSGVHRDTILAAAQGIETMRLDSARKLAIALDLPIEDLFPGPELWPKETSI